MLEQYNDSGSELMRQNDTHKTVTTIRRRLKDLFVKPCTVTGGGEIVFRTWRHMLRL